MIAAPPSARPEGRDRDPERTTSPETHTGEGGGLRSEATGVNEGPGLLGDGRLNHRLSLQKVFVDY